VIIDSFGDGGIPFTYGDWEKDIGYLLDRDIPVVVISQTGGQATMSVYEPGLRMKQKGVTPGMNMMREAAITKLMWIAGSYPSLSGQAMMDMFQKNICGEYYTASPSSAG
jgi:L-asparaginase/Glu-tRNA(Gln) amidotransferase subunit D